MENKSATTPIAEAAKSIVAFAMGFILASICWHFAGVDYTDKTPISGAACFMSMLVGGMFFCARER